MKRNLLLFNIVFLFSAMIIAQPIEELDSRIHKDFYNRDLNIDFLNTNTCTDSLTFSSESIFNHAHTLFTSVTSLTENKFVVVYSDHGNSKYGTAVIGTITDDSISYGSCYIFNSWPTARLWVTSLDTNSFVISYGDSLNFFNDHESVIAGSVVGNEISFGNQVVFSTSYGYYDNPVTRLNLNTFVVVYRDNNNSDYGTAVIGSVSGNTISMGTGYVYSSSINTGGEFAGRNSLTYLDSTKFVVTYTNYNNNYNGVAIVGTVLGNAITFGAEYVFSIGRSLQLSATCLDPEHFVVSYTDVENGDYGTSIVGTVSGNIITFGSEYEFFSEWTSYISSSRLQANRFVVVYWNWENNIHNGTSRVGYVDGNGRIGRVVNNYMLTREGYVPINIKFIDRRLYYEAFKEFDSKGKTTIMQEIVGKALTNSYHKRLAYLEEMKIITLSEYAKQSGISHSNLINKAKRQTIEAFFDKGNWKIGIPFS